MARKILDGYSRADDASGAFSFLIFSTLFAQDWIIENVEHDQFAKSNRNEELCMFGVNSALGVRLRNVAPAATQTAWASWVGDGNDDNVFVLRGTKDFGIVLVDLWAKD